ncbi:uncharacterized protein F5147DRAFT_657121 [Suillus discolor]|uniref:Uncharacterized protein n=1 Tax=Suillus discolor TaxID=1912936 RepID=A0A9P7JPE0_9AGAM|nr:uncharacterized protein F5147DRAFT_657121 [Suillus discolor]KAG2094646.1 hypothetical protein F5147DRAFT_657121 [Suillus discolor]
MSKNLKGTEHSVVVFDILEPQGKGQIYSNPWMNCTSMGESLDMGFQPAGELDPRHAHDTMNSSSNMAVICPASTSGIDMSIENNPLDMGFSSLLAEDEHVVQRPLDMGFCRDPVHDVPAGSLDMQLWTLNQMIALWIWDSTHSNRMGTLWTWDSTHSNQMGTLWIWDSTHSNRTLGPWIRHPLDMGFNTLQPDNGPLDPGFNAIQLDEHPLDMDSVHSIWYIWISQCLNLLIVNPVDIQLDQKPLDMGFGTAALDPVHGLADGEPEPIGFVIQRAVGDLRLAIHWLEMDQAHSIMSPEEASVSQEVLQSAHELLLAFQLISIYRLST